MTSRTPVYTAHDVPDLINALPTLFGFRPSESLVAIATHGHRRRFGFRLRVDMPAGEQVEEVARLVVRHLGNQGAEGAIVIAVTQHQDLALELLDAVQAVLGPIALIVRARTDGAQYWTDEPGASGDGVPFETSDHHLAIVQAIAEGQEILPDRQALVDRYAAVTGERREWLMHGTAAVLDEIVPVVARCPVGQLAATGMRVLEPILRRGLAGGPLSDADLLRIAAWVSCISVRDEVWALVHRDNAAEMLSLLLRVCRTVVPPFEPAVLSLAAFAAWMTGDGAQALIAVERAVDADSEYPMATMLLELIEGGVSPIHWHRYAADRAC